MDFQEILVGVEIFRAGQIEFFLRSLLEIADIENKGYLSQEEVLHVFKAICFKYEEMNRMRGFIHDVYLRIPSDEEGFFLAEDFEREALEHVYLMITLQENISCIRRIDKQIENDLEEHFQVWVPLSNNIVKFKEGIHFPIVSELLTIVKNNEELQHNLKMKKQKFIEESRRNNMNDFSDDGEDEEDK